MTLLSASVQFAPESFKTRNQYMTSCFCHSCEHVFVLLSVSRKMLDAPPPPPLQVAPLTSSKTSGKSASPSSPSKSNPFLSLRFPSQKGSTCLHCFALSAWRALKMVFCFAELTTLARCQVESLRPNVLPTSCCIYSSNNDNPERLIQCTCT